MIHKNNLWNITAGLSVVGIFLASYLFYNYLTKPVFESCYINNVINCDAVTKGTLSTVFGIPVPLIGFAGYFIILLSSLLRKKGLLLSMTTFGLLFCFYLIVQEIFIIRVICPVCLACLFIMFAIFLLAIYLNWKNKN